MAFNPEGDLFVALRPSRGSNEAWVVQIDPSTGEMLGRIDVGAHELAFASDGTLLPATRSKNLLLFRPLE